VIARALAGNRRGNQEALSEAICCNRRGIPEALGGNHEGIPEAIGGNHEGNPEALGGAPASLTACGHAPPSCCQGVPTIWPLVCAVIRGDHDGGTPLVCAVATYVVTPSRSTARMHASGDGHCHSQRQREAATTIYTIDPQQPSPSAYHTSRSKRKLCWLRAYHGT